MAPPICSFKKVLLVRSPKCTYAYMYPSAPLLALKVLKFYLVVGTLYPPRTPFTLTPTTSIRPNPHKGYYRFDYTTHMVYECYSGNCLGGSVLSTQCALGASGPLCDLCYEVGVGPMPFQ